MKKRNLGILTCLMLTLAGCYDDSDLRNRIGAIEDDITSINGEIAGIKEQIAQINTNITALQTVVDALEDKVYVSSVTEVKDQDSKETIGYTIIFSDNTITTIYHGEDGEDGETGAAGEKGAAGAAGHTPVIGVKLANGEYCWTVDGEFLLDDDENVIPVNGVDGQNGITPQLRITDGYWEVSYGDDEWETLGSASGEVTAVDAVFSGVKETTEGVVFILTDGSKLIIPRAAAFGLVFDKVTGYEVGAGTTTSIPYTISNGTETTVVDAFASGNWEAEVQMTDYKSGVINVTASEDGKSGKVMVYATDGLGKTDIKTLTFGNGVLSAVMETLEVPVAGGNITVNVTSNIDYSIEISDTWLYIAPVTRAGEIKNESVTLAAGENTTPDIRTAEVKILDPQGAAVQTFSVTQAAGTWNAPVFTCENLKKYVLDYFDTDEDDEISQDEAANAEEINYMELSYGPVSSFVGIESLYNLKKLKIDTRYSSTPSTVASGDFSKNSKLEDLDIQIKSLTNINVSGLTNLKSLNIASTAIETVDLSSLANLQALYAQSSSLTSIDISANKALVELSVYGTKITTLNTASCPELKELIAGTATLGSITLNNPALERLTIDDITATSIDFSSLKSLTYFQAYRAKNLVEINLSNSPHLTVFYGEQYNVGTIDVSSASQLSTFNIGTCTRLDKIRFSKAVESKTGGFTYPKSYWTNGGDDSVKVTVEFVEGETVSIEDYTSLMSDEYARKAVLKAYDSNNDGKIDEEEVSKVTELDFSDYGLTTTEGLEVFPSLEKLVLSGNSLTEFDASLFTGLKHLDLSNNQLSSINVKSISGLEYFDASGNSLSGSISRSQLPYSTLTHVYISDNPSLNVDLSDCSSLIEADFSNTATNTIYTTYWYASDLKTLKMAGTGISGALKFPFLTSLETIDISNTAITSIDISAAAAQGTVKKILAEGSSLGLVIVGPGNFLGEDVIEGAEDCGVLNVTNPTKDIESNQWNYISDFTAGNGATVKDFTINYAKTSKGFVINAGGEASITATAGRKVLKFFAIGVNGTPTVEIVRSSDKAIFTKSTDLSSWGESYKSTSENPLTVRNNAAAASDETRLLIDGDADWHKFNLGAQGNSSNNTEEGETITFKINGNQGEKVIIFGINLSTSRDDEE